MHRPLGVTHPQRIRQVRGGKRRLPTYTPLVHPPTNQQATIAVVFLQPQCNMTCSFCITENEVDRIEFEEAVELLDHLQDIGIRNVILGGGEPFSWPGDPIALAREAKARDMIVQVGTNGLDLPEGFAKLDCVDRWILPLESVESEVHDAMRHAKEGHHRTVLERLEELQQESKSVTVSTVLTAVNVVGLAELSRYLEAYHSVAENVHAWHLYQFLPAGRGGARNGKELWIPPGMFHEVCDSIQQAKLPFQVFRRTDMYETQSIAFFWSENGHIRRGGRVLDGAMDPKV